MSNNDIYWTLQTAIEYGGGFYRRLAEATLLADPNNRSRVLVAFPEIIQASSIVSNVPNIRQVMVFIKWRLLAFSKRVLNQKRS